METAIKKAIEGGWKCWGRNGLSFRPSTSPRQFRFEGEDYPPFLVGYQEITLDPAFWVALGKACEWEGIQWYSIYDGFRPSSWTHRYHYEWHRFIDHLASGKSADEFFEELLN